MEFDPQNISDEQLDALLRDVKIPSDLKTSLLKVAESDGKPSSPDVDADHSRTTNPSTNGPNGRIKSWMLALAASLLAISTFSAWQWIANDTSNGVQVASPNIVNSPANSRSETDRSSLALARIDHEIESISAILDEIKLNQKRQNYVANEQRYASDLQGQEVNSIILALSQQIILPLGGREESVKSKMANVINTYPDSMGAELAKEFLEQLNN